MQITIKRKTMFLEYHKKRFIHVKNKGNIEGGKNPSTGCKNHQKIEQIHFLQIHVNYRG